MYRDGLAYDDGGLLRWVGGVNSTNEEGHSTQLDKLVPERSALLSHMYDDGHKTTTANNAGLRTTTCTLTLPSRQCKASCSRKAHRLDSKTRGRPNEADDGSRRRTHGSFTAAAIFWPALPVFTRPKPTAHQLERA